MSGQEIKIPVSAQTHGAVGGLENVAEAAEGVAAGVQKITDAAKAAQRAIKDAAATVRDLAKAREVLNRETGLKLTDRDAAIAMSNFDRMKKGRTAAARSVRNFTDYEGWANGYRGMYRTPREAARAGRAVHEGLLENTSARQGGAADFEPPGGGGGGHPGGGGGGGGGSGGGGAASGVRKIQSTALGFGKSMLALAGIGSVMGMATRAADLATEESTGIDTLKRRLGDLGVSFDELRSQARGAGEGLGVTWVESQRLAQAYTKEVGNLGATDLQGHGLQDRLRNNIGFSRSYGIDPAEGTQFFGQMARFGVGRDEQSQRRLAMLIGDSVAKSGYSGQVEELLHAVADYTAMSARMTLSAPNSDAYTNALTSLIDRKIPGLDPAGAASMLNSADQATRRGGAMGEASLSFSYAALRNANPGISPVQAMSLMEGGLFGTTRGMFGGKNNPLGKYLGRGIALDDRTTFDKEMPLLRRMYDRKDNHDYFIDAIKNHFGLSSHAQAAAFADLQDKGLLGATGTALSKAGVDPMTVNATGMPMIASLANAKSGDLEKVFNDILGRNDITPDMRKAMQTQVNAARPGGEEATRTAMIAAVAKLNIAQEKTPGTEVRDSIANLTDKLTQAGSAELAVLNPIRDAVVAMANHFTPGYMDTTGGRAVGTAPWAAENQGVGKAGGAVRTEFEQHAMKTLMASGLTKVQAAGVVGGIIAESNGDPLAIGDHGQARGLFQMHADRWNAFTNWARKKGLDPNSSDAQLAYFPYDIENSESGAGMMIKGAKTARAAAIGMVDYERPGGYSRFKGNYQDANNWAGRSGQAERLASMNLTPQAPAGAGAAPATGVAEATVNVNVNGKKVGKVKVAAPVGKPVASGAGMATNPSTVAGGTFSYPLDLDYR